MGNPSPKISDMETRIDKWLWAVRLFKTRSLAAEACGKGHVRIGDVQAKSSREVHVGDEVRVRMAPIERRYIVRQAIDKRVSAPLAAECLEDITPQDQLDLLDAAKGWGHEFRERGSGRPTKRDRRMIDRLKNGLDED